MKIKRSVPAAACFICLALAGAAQRLAAAEAGEGLTLEDCLALAVRDNREINIARGEVAAAKGDRMSAIAGFLPKLALKGAGQRQSQDSYASDLLASQVDSPVKRSKDLYHLGLEFEQPIYIGGYNAAEFGYAKAQLSRAASRLNDRILNVRITVAGAFYEILALEKKIDALKEAVDFMTAHTKVVSSQVKNRVALKTSYLSAEVLLLSSRRDLLKAQNALQLAKRRFNSLLGRDPAGELGLKGELTRDGPEADLTAASGDRLDLHPAVMAAKFSVEMGEHAVGMAKADMYRPKLKLIGNYNLTEDTWVPRKEDWSVALGLEIPLFTSKPFGAVRKYEAQVYQARTGLEFSREQVSLEIQSVYLELTQAGEALALTGKVVEQAQENVRICNLGYAGGTASNEQLLDARRDLIRATLEHISTLCEYNQAQARLKYHLEVLKK